VLVHGLGFGRKRWASQTNALLAAGFRVLSYDLRGFGDSDPATVNFTIEQLAADLEAVREAAGLERFHLVGHSLGGMCAQQYTLNHSERVQSLVLASTTSHSGQRGSAYGAALSHLAHHGFDAAMEDDSFRSKVEWAVEFLADPSVRAELNGTISEELPDGERLLKLIKRMTETADPARAYAWHATVGFSTRKRLGEITCPSLVLHGTRDMIIPYVAGQLLHKGLKGSSWMSFKGAGHNISVECEAVFNDTLLSFLQDTSH
jgi:pimeloyl-ACP methyl ester carboxylesterase